MKLVKIFCTKLVCAQEEMLEPAVNGTKNVIIGAAEAKVRRVVFTSSIGTVYMNPNTSRDVLVDESFWSDLEYCKNTKVNESSPMFPTYSMTSTTCYIY